MTSSPASRSPSVAGRIALADVFTPATLAKPADLVAATLSVPGSLQRALADWCEANAWMVDTPWLAGWLLLSRRWTGSVGDALQFDTSSGALIRIRWPQLAAAAPEQTVEDWCRAVELARHVVEAVAAGDGDRPNATESEVLWDAADRSTPARRRQVGLVLGHRNIASSELWLEAVASWMDEAQARVVLESLCELVDAMVRDPLVTIDAVGVVQDAGRVRICGPTTNALSADGAAVTVHERFAQCTVRFATRPALIDESGVTLTYGELAARAAALAARLQSMGVLPGATVAVALDRSATAIEANLAILQCGAAYLPLDLGSPATRLRHMIDETGVEYVITTAAKSGLVENLGRLLCVDRPPPEPAPRFDPALSSLGDDATAYVMYTSGSTGTPKGVEIRHRSILNLVVDATFVNLPPAEAVLHAAPPAFDASTFETWGALLNGGCCVIHPEPVPTAAGLGRSIRQHGVTTAWLTSALFNAVVDQDVQQLAGLRQLLVGGEALSVAHLRRAQAALPALRLINGYGPTECTTFTTTWTIAPGALDMLSSVPIGHPVAGAHLCVLGPTLAPIPRGLVGELHIGGVGLAKGYLRRADLSEERFVADPWGAEGERLYRTGDRVRQRADGALDYIGRADSQIKLRGMRIEPGEIETALCACPGVKSCAVVAERIEGRVSRLVAYLVASKPGHTLPRHHVQRHLEGRLPSSMWPAALVWLDELPVTANGKLDRKALPAPSTERPDLSQPYRDPVGESERCVCEAFARALGLDMVGRDDNFFDLGGHSLQAASVVAALAGEGMEGLSTTTFLEHSTPARLAAAHAASHAPSGRLTESPRRARAAEPIAVVAMAGRFPGAVDVEQFWDLLCAGRNGITHFEAGTLDASLPDELTADPQYVRARGVIDGVEQFDAAFFGLSPREADAMDPQQRVFLELCWECLERAGHAPDRCTAPVGVFAGMNNATYFQRHLAVNASAVAGLGEFATMLANEKDYLATRVAHKLDLRGPAVSVNTACSTSLVAIAQAVSSLRAGQCDMALAGGVAINCPPRSGYVYNEGAMLSPDGHTRSFDAESRGTVFSDGAGVILLKRLGDALADGNPVIALVRGVAINNDGRNKASFTAPSVEGQAAVVAAALGDAEVDARSIGYIEAHGTATPLGDPVEIEALTRVFREATTDRGFCRIGSVKSNVGHLVTAAGVAGVIKTALSLAHERIPATLHFERPNPKIDFASSPFVVNAALQPWPRSAQVRRAGVSSFGVGGTNAHVVLEEAAQSAPSTDAVGPQLLCLSARTAGSLDRTAQALAAHLTAHATENLADVAHTLRVGRSAFDQRLGIVAGSAAEAASALRDARSTSRVSGRVGARAAQTVWLFPGQGASYAGMGSGLYSRDEDFHRALDEVISALQDHLAVDLRERLFSDDPEALLATNIAQPAIWCVEVALGRAWLARGLKPAALLGHSLGEFAAAVLAGVMALDDGARLVARRGVLMQACPVGGMLSVYLPAATVATRLPRDVCVAADNAPHACVVSGPLPALGRIQALLEHEGVAVRPLAASGAFHSPLMDGALAPFAQDAARIVLHAPSIPIISSLTGTWLTAAQATDPQYWVRHLREPVRFNDAVRTSMKLSDMCYLEIGPRDTLCKLLRQQRLADGSVPTAHASWGDSPGSEVSGWLQAQAAVWVRGADIELTASFPPEGRRRVCLPTTAFDRQRHWIDAPPAAPPAKSPTAQPYPAPAVTRKDMSLEPPPAQPVAAPSARVSTTTAVPEASVSATPRHARLLSQVMALFEDVSGMDLSAVEPSSRFVEVGLDSLTLTQASLQMKKRLGVAISFRQLMEGPRSFEALARHVDEALPPEPSAAPVAPTPVHPTAIDPLQAAIELRDTASATPLPPAQALGTFIEQVIVQQMQLMSQQLALLAGSAAATPSAPSGVAPASLPTTDAAAPLPATAEAVPPSGRGSEPAEVASVRYDVKKAFGAIARIHTQPAELTERQRRRLDALVQRYTERTRQSKAYTERHRPHLADPRVVNGFRPVTKEMAYQIVIERSQGARLWDIDGNEYVDALNGFGMNLFGWQPTFVQDAVRRQLDAGYEIGPQHPLAGEVAQLVCELTGFDRAGLCNTGSEAVMAAIRIARTVTGRSTLVLFSGSYHGTFDEVVVRPGRGGQGIPAAPGILAGAFGDVVVLDYGTAESLVFIREHADEIAAVLVEPVQSRRPDFQPREFLQDLRAITAACGTCLIFDEVITGFRSHVGGVQALFGLRADLACYGKVIGGGFPVGVVAGKRDYMDALDGGAWQFGDSSMPTVGVTYFAGTFVRHPLALAAAKASLEHLRDHSPGLQTQLTLHTAALADELNAFCRDAGAPIAIRHFASLWRVSWQEDHPLQDLLFAMMRSRGVHILDNFPCFLTTAHTSGDIALIKTAFKQSVAELQEADFLPRGAMSPTIADATRPPVPNARLGRDRDGQPAWFVPDPATPGQYIKVSS